MSEMSVEIDSSGAIARLNEFMQNFMQVNTVLEEDVNDGVEMMVETARILVPVATGNLRDSIHYEGSFPNYSIVVDAQNEYGQYYGYYVEWGTSKMGAQPFLWPAINAVLPKLVYRIRRHVDRKSVV